MSATACGGIEAILALDGGSDPVGSSSHVVWNIAWSAALKEPGRECGRARERVPRRRELGRLGEGRPCRLEVEEVQHVMCVGVAVGQGREIPLGLDQLQDGRVVEGLM